MQCLRVLSRRATTLHQLFHGPRPQAPLRQLGQQPKLNKDATPFSTRSWPTTTGTSRACTAKIPRRPLTWTRMAARSTRRYKSSSAAAEQPLSLGQRLKKLSREYGRAAICVYFALSALDFPFCFLAVRTLGTDRIGHWEHAVVSTVKEWIPWLGHSDHASSGSGSGSGSGVDDSEQHVDHGYKEAEAANRGSNASVWTQLALAYAIHKSFIFIRVPLTAAVTPKVVKTLRGWGWNIGKPLPKRLAKKVD